MSLKLSRNKRLRTAVSFSDFFGMANKIADLVTAVNPAAVIEMRSRTALSKNGNAKYLRSEGESSADEQSRLESCALSQFTERRWQESDRVELTGTDAAPGSTFMLHLTWGAIEPHRMYLYVQGAGRTLDDRICTVFAQQTALTSVTDGDIDRNPSLETRSMPPKVAKEPNFVMSGV